MNLYDQFVLESLRVQSGLFELPRLRRVRRPRIRGVPMRLVRRLVPRPAYSGS